MKVKLKKVEEGCELDQTMLAFSNKQITSLKKDLIGAKTSFEKSWQEKYKLLE